MAGVGSGLVGVVSGLAVNTVIVRSAWLARGLWVATALLVVSYALLQRAPVRAGGAGGAVDAAVDAVRRRVRRQWSEQAVLRWVRRPEPLNLRWTAFRGGGPGRAESGTVDTIVAAYRALPHRQLVVLGEPGAGKTGLAMLLVLGLIEDPEPDEPVPVIFSVASWNPALERLDAYLARQLVRDHAELAVLDADGRSHAARLVDEGRLLPVLDGLDELTAGMPVAALREIELFAADGRPLVVTCRTREFADAIDQDVDSVPSRAAVIEIRPVGAGSAAAFLAGAQQPGRWRGVAECLRADPGGPLARVLSTPLMIGLARAAYRDPATTPDDLLDRPDEATIARVVMDAYVADAYRPRAGGGDPRYDPQRAGRWLTYLAYRAQAGGGREVAPRHLDPLAFLRRQPGRDAQAVAAVLGMAALVAVVALPVGGFAAALVASAVAGAVVWMNVADVHAGVFARAWQQRPATTRARLALDRALFGAAGGLLAGAVLGDPPLAAVGGVLGALGCALVPAWAPPVRAATVSPGALRRRTRWEIGTATVQYAILGWLGGAAAGAVLGGRPGLAAPVTAGVFAVSAALAAGLWRAGADRAAGLVLAARGWLPWRPWAFVEDGLRRGTMRQTGALVEFRHALLQDHLADQGRLAQSLATIGSDPVNEEHRYVDALAMHGHGDEAREMLTAMAERGTPGAVKRLAYAYAADGRIDDGIRLLRERFAGKPHRLFLNEAISTLLADAGRLEELHASILDGSLPARGYAARVLARALADEGRLADLRELAGSEEAFAQQLAEHHAAAGDLEALRAMADAVTMRAVRAPYPVPDQLGPAPGASYAARRLAELLRGQNRLEDLAELAETAGHTERAVSAQLYLLLADRGDIEALRRAATDTPDAAAVLVHALLDEGWIEDVLPFLQADPRRQRPGTVRSVVAALVEQGRVGNARALLRGYLRRNNWNTAHLLADVIAATGLLPATLSVLYRRVDADAALEKDIVALLVRAGDLDRAVAFLRSQAARGSDTADDRLAQLLIGTGRRDAGAAILRARAAVGHYDAFQALRNLADAPPEPARPEPAGRPAALPVRADRRTALAIAVVPAALLLGAVAVGAAAGRLPVEALNLPIAMLLLGSGLLAERRRPDLGSWTLYSAPLLAGLVPTLILTYAGADSPARRVLLLAGALAVAAVGTWRRQRAPICIGLVVFAVAACREIAVLTSPWVTVAFLAAGAVAAGPLLITRYRRTRAPW